MDTIFKLRPVYILNIKFLSTIKFSHGTFVPVIYSAYSAYSVYFVRWIYTTPQITVRFKWQTFASLLWIRTPDPCGCRNTAYQVESPALYLLGHWDMSKWTRSVKLVRFESRIRREQVFPLWTWNKFVVVYSCISNKTKRDMFDIAG